MNDRKLKNPQIVRHQTIYFQMITVQRSLERNFKYYELNEYEKELIIFFLATAKARYRGIFIAVNYRL